MRNRGFTLIELMVTIAILGILGMVVFGAITGANSGNTISYGINGVVEMRCINGLEFTVSNGHARQVYDQLGHGVPCK